MIAADAQPIIPSAAASACVARFAQHGSDPRDQGSWRARLVRTRIAYRLRPAGRVVGVLRPAADAEATMPWGMVVRAEAVDGTCRIGLQLPVRPNGRVGWVDERYVHLAWSPWRIEVSRVSRSARLLYEGRAVRRFSVDIGTSATPTPPGLFAVLRVMSSSDDSPYGAWVLALTAESDHIFRFAGGPGRIGLHGRGGASLHQPLGKALSFGCVRFTNTAIRYIVSRVGPSNLPGTAVRIR